jgi:hypothetical protein
MTKFKDFGTPVSDNKESVSFKLHNEDFFCVPSVQGKVLLNLVANSNSDDPSDTVKVIDEFFKYVLQDESYERFDKLIVSKDRFVSVETLGEITSWIIEQVTSRPNSQPEA